MWMTKGFFLNNVFSSSVGRVFHSIQSFQSSKKKKHKSFTQILLHSAPILPSSSLEFPGVLIPEFSEYRATNLINISPSNNGVMEKI